MSDIAFTRVKTEDDGIRYYVGGERDTRPFALYAGDLVDEENHRLENQYMPDGWYELKQQRGGEAWVWIGTTAQQPTVT